MTVEAVPGGAFTMAEDLTVARMGYGAMQLAGPGVFGPPAHPGDAIAVLREAVRLGINHIDTADFYGPHVTNQLIRQALRPYQEDLRIITKVGAVRGARGGWLPAGRPEQLRAQVHDNLRNLGLDALDVVNLRVPDGRTEPWLIAEQFTELARLRQEGLIRHLGLSAVNAEQVAAAQAVAPVLCVQNYYNIASRADDDLIDSLAEQGIAYVPYSPLAGIFWLRSLTLRRIAARLGATPSSVAIAWLLRRSPNILLIPGTSAISHLRQNVAAAALAIPGDMLRELNGIGAGKRR
jgi:pyridoxine 4-dehydrogenase